MEFKKATIENLDDIMHIIKGSQAYLKSQGVDQWQDGYPNNETIGNDIDNNNSYILLQDNMILAVAAVIEGPDKTYKSIYNGNWVTDNEYMVIHRMAVNPRFHGQGIGTKIIKHVEQITRKKGIKSIKVDTHKANISMQKVLIKNEFEYCGIIYLEDGDERMAFEKVFD